MPPKPPRGSDGRKTGKRWFATHRVNANGDWQASDGEGWYPVEYDEVPDSLWSMNFRRDGWRFYTDRTRECDKRGFPVNN